MISTITTNEAVDMLLGDIYAKWTLSAAKALVEHIEANEDSMGEDYLFHPCDVRNEWSKYASLADFAQCYSGSLGGVTDKDSVRDWIRERASLIEYDGGIIVTDI